MWLTSERASGRKTLLQYSSLTPLERECYEGEVEPYRKTDYKPIIYIILKASSQHIPSKLWSTIKAIDGKSSPKAENEAITFDDSNIFPKADCQLLQQTV